LTPPAQYARIFANHPWYYGDQHYGIAVGPSRAAGMALSLGVPFSLHTDAGVTPPGCLHSMWCAVNRVTPKGRVLGEGEKITAEQALHAVTLGSAYLLGLDDQLGSILPGEWADFTILDQSRWTWIPRKSATWWSGAPSWRVRSTRAQERRS